MKRYASRLEMIMARKNQAPPPAKQKTDALDKAAQKRQMRMDKRKDKA